MNPPGEPPPFQDYRPTMPSETHPTISRIGAIGSYVKLSDGTMWQLAVGATYTIQTYWAEGQHVAVNAENAPAGEATLHNLDAPDQSGPFRARSLDRWPAIERRVVSP